MAKYGKKSQDKVEKAMHEMKRGELKSGKSGKTVKRKEIFFEKQKNVSLVTALRKFLLNVTITLVITNKKSFRKLLTPRGNL